MGRRRAAAVVLQVALQASLLFAGGCGRRHGRVSGTVTVDGRPLDHGVVNFIGAGGAASAPVLSGAYDASPVPVGRAGIAVRATPRPAVADPAAAAVDFVPLPDRYIEPERSGLSLDVVAGDQRHDISISTR